jgi:hypothetical protein
MKILILSALGILLLNACGEKPSEKAQTSTAVTSTAVVSSQTAVTQSNQQRPEKPVTTGSVAETSTAENEEHGTWVGQIAVGQPVSMFNYVGAESGDFAPMRFRNDSEAGKKILAVCSNGAMCEFSGAIEWLDETPPANASAIGQIIRVDRVRAMPAATP